MRASSALIRRTSAAAVAALLATGLAACGSDATNTAGTTGTTDATSPATQSAAAQTSGAGAGATISPSQMKDILSRGISSITSAHAEMSMDASVSGQSMKMTGAADMRMKPLAESMTMTMTGATIQARLVDGTMYMQSPAFNVGQKWVKMSSQDMSRLGGGMSSAMSNPLSVVDQMADYIHGASVVGTETVNGVSGVTHYKMSVDVKGMATKMGVPSAALAQLPASADEDVWIDPQGHVVKTIARIGSMETVSVVMSDFGKTVDVQAPPADQVADMSSLGH